MIRIGLLTLTLAAGSLLMAGTAHADKSADKTAKTQAVNTTTKQAWAPETLSGTIMIVNPDSRLLVVKDASGVPFDLRITPATRIESNGMQATLQDLTQSGDKGRNVTVRMVPERGGDIARSVNVTG